MTDPQTIAELVERSASTRGASPWLHFGDQIYSFEEAAERANGAAEQLADLGVDRGQVVASVLPNSAQAVFLWFGLMQLGALHLPLNPRATAPELAGTLRHAEPVLLVGTSAASLAGEPGVDTVRVGGPHGARLLFPVLPGSDLQAALR